MRTLLGILSLLFVISSCEKDLTSENPDPVEENIVAHASFVYGNNGLKRDTLYTNQLGQSFYFEDINLVFSGFTLAQGADTILHDSTLFQLSFDDREEPLVFLEPGGYSLKYQVKLGVDSLRGANLTSGDLQADDIDASGVLRGQKQGINHIIIKGRMPDPSKPDDSTAFIPLQYKIGTYLTTKEYSSDQLNFSVIRRSTVPLIFYIDVEPIFNDFNFLSRPIVETEISNPIDLAIAVQMADSLRVGLF